jgi:hypothetical protein
VQAPLPLICLMSLWNVSCFPSKTSFRTHGCEKHIKRRCGFDHPSSSWSAKADNTVERRKCLLGSLCGEHTLFCTESKGTGRCLYPSGTKQGCTSRYENEYRTSTKMYYMWETSHSFELMCKTRIVCVCCDLCGTIHTLSFLSSFISDDIMMNAYAQMVNG